MKKTLRFLALVSLLFFWTSSLLKISSLVLSFKLDEAGSVVFSFFALLLSFMASAFLVEEWK